MTPLAARDPFRVGLVALAAVLALALAVVGLSVLRVGTATYTAELAHTGGLRAGEDVQVAGVPVGEVAAVELAAGGTGDTVVVTFTVADDLVLGDRTSAAVEVATLLGTHYLEVDPAGDGALPDGRVPLARTSVPFDLQGVLEAGTATLEGLDGPGLAGALTAVSETLAVAGDDVAPALAGVARLSDVVVRRAGQTGALLRAAREVSDLVEGSATDLEALMRQTTLVVTEVTRRREAIDRLLDETTVLADALTAVVVQTEDDLGPALDDLGLALASLRRQDRSLQRVLRVMAPAMRYLANAAGNGPFVDLYLQGPAIPGDDARCTLTGGC